MAGSSSNWFKTKSGKGSAKGRVFISNAVIAKVGAAYIPDGTSDLTRAKAEVAGDSDSVLLALSKISAQPKGQAKPKPPAGPPALPPGWASDPEAQALIKAQSVPNGMARAFNPGETDFNAAFRDTNEDVLDGFPAALKKAIREYQDDGFFDINTDLWAATRGADKSLPADSTARALMRAVSQTVAPFDMTVTRASARKSELYMWAESAHVGAAYINQGFDSSSLNPDINVHGSGVKLRMRVPKGSRGAALNTMGGAAQFRDEQEWLIPANGTWVVSGKMVGADGKIEITVDLVDQRDFSGKIIWP